MFAADHSALAAEDMNKRAAKLFEELTKVLEAQLTIVHQLSHVFSQGADTLSIREPYDMAQSIGLDPTAASKKKRKKRTKDPEAPKRPKTAYLCFVTKNMERLRAETGKPQKEIMRMLGENWKSLPEQARTDFEKQAADSRAEWEQEVASYKQRKEENAAAANALNAVTASTMQAATMHMAMDPHHHAAAAAMAMQPTAGMDVHSLGHAHLAHQLQQHAQSQLVRPVEDASAHHHQAHPQDLHAVDAADEHHRAQQQAQQQAHQAHQQAQQAHHQHAQQAAAAAAAVAAAPPPPQPPAPSADSVTAAAAAAAAVAAANAVQTDRHANV